MIARPTSLVTALGLVLVAAAASTQSASAVGLALMEHTTLVAYSGKLSDGSRTAEYSLKFTGSTDYYSKMDFATGSSAGGFLMAMGEAAGPDSDVVVFGWQAPSALGFSSIVGGGSFRVTFSTAVAFEDFGDLFGYSGTTFRIGQSVVTDGQVFDAGTYTFQWTASHSGELKSDFIAGATFTSVPPPAGNAVPLPGAAAAAAAGLALGRSGRRRR